MITIIYLNEDAFAVPRAAFLAKVDEVAGDWIRVTEWVEQEGTFLGHKLRHPHLCLPLET